jgi:hypothetical protein
MSVLVQKEFADVIEITITCDICGEREGRDETTSLAKRLWRQFGWRIFGDGSAVCPDCVAIVGKLS